MIALLLALAIKNSKDNKSNFTNSSPGVNFKKLRHLNKYILQTEHT